MSELNGFPESCCGRVLQRGQSCLDGYENGIYYPCRYALDRRRRVMSEAEQGHRLESCINSCTTEDLVRLCRSLIECQQIARVLTLAPIISGGEEVSPPALVLRRAAFRLETLICQAVSDWDERITRRTPARRWMG